MQLLYGMVCLLCWREPSRSQCWLALAGLGLIVLASIAGLGICSLVGLPFNVLSVQVSALFFNTISPPFFCLLSFFFISPHCRSFPS